MLTKQTILRASLVSFILLIAVSCSISYKFNGASIDYNVTKTITIKDFPNQAPLVMPTLAQQFTNSVQDIYIRQTRLTMIPNNGDLELEGEITGFDLAPTAVREDMYASRTKLTITVRVRYTNKNKQEDDFEQSFSAFREFDANIQLQDVQDQLSEEICKELADMIYNATVANW